MEKKFEELVGKPNISPLSIDILRQISLILKGQDNGCLCSFVHESYESLLMIERWVWKVLSSGFFDEWINEEHYQEFFYTIASFNKNLILNNDDIELSVKTALLLSVSTDQISCTADELVHWIRDDYLQIVHIHSRTVALWSKELLGCMTQLISFVGGLCWWDGHNGTQIKVLLVTEQTICDHIEDLIRIIDYRPFHKEMKSVRSNDETSIMDAALMILMSIVKTQNVSWFFRSNVSIQNALSTLGEEALYDEICLSVYSILSEVLSDEQLKSLKIANNMGVFFFNMLEKAWHHPLKKYRQIQIEYLLQGSVNLSKHDFIQQETAKMNKIPLFIEMSDQYPIVFDIIWALSFNHDIQQQLRSHPSFIHKLSQLAKESDDEQMRKIAHGILWNLEITHQDRSIPQSTNENTFHIMISYSHKEKILCKQLYDELTKNGYRVWIDFDQMHGNVMDAMAQAIDRSEIIIICMSEQYRQSNFCRAEAHYAFQRQRRIVPVLMQKHYKPDGWLLFLIGQLLYVDFTEHEFVRVMEMLSKELKAIHVPDMNITRVQREIDIDIILPNLSVSSPQTFSNNILQRSQIQVHQWLLQHRLVQLSHLLINCNDRSLVHLYKYIEQGQISQILSLLQKDSLRRINQCISLIELSCFILLCKNSKQLNQLKSVEI
ncbi:unnamed protein product [Adineta steineri]|uniref:TIR domain-containing protein n=1 Tax=Adineta steineri TaxID=433720 RepID=A0A819WXQ4_9BILA|nr:unnamed protein product [Adineta steineri]